MDEDLTVIWSTESSRKIQEIKNYLTEHFSIKEVNYFLDKLRKFEILIKYYPRIYPRSLSNPNLRKAVITRHNSVIYEVDGKFIRIHTLFDNRQENKL